MATSGASVKKSLNWLITIGLMTTKKADSRPTRRLQRRRPSP